MTDIITPPKSYVKDTHTIKGKGMFASQNYLYGDVIEIAPVIILLMPYPNLPPRLKTRVFNWGSLTNGTPASALALGYGSLYNHANPANMKFVADKENETILFIATQAISKDQELTINYNGPNGDAVSHQDDWFSRQNIQLLEESE
jgi:hypothetical protein